MDTRLVSILKRPFHIFKSETNSTISSHKRVRRFASLDHCLFSLFEKCSFMGNLLLGIFSHDYLYSNSADV